MYVSHTLQLKQGLKGRESHDAEVLEVPGGIPEDGGGHELAPGQASLVGHCLFAFFDGFCLESPQDGFLVEYEGISS